MAAWWDAGGWPDGATDWVYQAKSGGGITIASLADSYVNQAHPGTDGLSALVAPTLVAGGWQFARGAGSYLITPLVPDNGAWSVLCQYADGVVNVANGLFGSSSGPTRLLAAYFDAQSLACANGGSTFKYTLPTLVAGNVAISGNRFYRDGALQEPTLNAWSGTGTAPLWIGAMNYPGFSPYDANATISAVIVCNRTLDADQVAAKAAAMADLHPPIIVPQAPGRRVRTGEPSAPGPTATARARTHVRGRAEGRVESQGIAKGKVIHDG